MAVVGTSSAPVIGRSGGLGWDQPELPWSGQQEKGECVCRSSLSRVGLIFPSYKNRGHRYFGCHWQRGLSRGLGVTVGTETPDISQAAQGHHITPAGAGLQRRLQQRHVKVMCILCMPQGWQPRGAARLCWWGPSLGDNLPGR